MKTELIKLMRLIVICACLCLSMGIMVAMLLRTSLWIEQKAYLYRLLLLTFLCCMVIFALTIFAFSKRDEIFGVSFSVMTLSIIASALFMSLFFALGPMTIERSYTIFSLADMAETSDTVYSAEEIKERFITDYIEGANESQKRIDEQVFIGNMEQVDGGYRITDKGEKLIKLMRFIELIFPVPDENSIYPNGK